MTLMEVLAGVLLLALIGALGFSLLTGTQRLYVRQSDTAEALAPASEALSVLVDDLMGCFIPDSGQAPFFLLQEGAEGSELTCVTTVPPVEEDAPLSRFQARRVAWRLEAVPEKGTTAWVRTGRTERLAGEEKESRLAVPGVTAFELKVYDPGLREWVPQWSAGRGGSLPAAARIRVKVRTASGEESLETSTVIPAGMVISTDR